MPIHIPDSPFGRIISPSQVEKWIMDYSALWFTDYLAEVERQVGVPPRFYQPLKSIVTANEFDHWADEELPSLVIMNTGLYEPPRKRSTGYDSTWLIGAAIVVTSQTKKQVRASMNDYGTAFMNMLLQNPSLGHPDDVIGVTWIDGRPAPLPSDSDRTLGAQQMLFTIEVAQVLDPSGHPPGLTPADDPYVPAPGDPLITSGSITIIKEGE